jgi:hypothetical protein
MGLWLRVLKVLPGREKAWHAKARTYPIGYARPVEKVRTQVLSLRQTGRGFFSGDLYRHQLQYP